MTEEKAIPGFNQAVSPPSTGWPNTSGSTSQAYNGSQVIRQESQDVGWSPDGDDMNEERPRKRLSSGGSTLDPCSPTHVR